MERLSSAMNGHGKISRNKLRSQATAPFVAYQQNRTANTTIANLNIPSFYEPDEIIRQSA